VHIISILPLSPSPSLSLSLVGTLGELLVYAGAVFDLSLGGRRLFTGLGKDEREG